MTRTVKLLLGPPERSDIYRLDDCFAYSFATLTESDKSNRLPQVIFQQDSLAPYQQKIANEHLAEFAAFYVMALSNPLKLRGDDLIAFLSSRKFEMLTRIGFDRVDELTDSAADLIDEHTIGAFQAFPHRPLIDDATSFSHPGHFNTAKFIEIVRENCLRSQFLTYCPVWRNYFVMRYATLCELVGWSMATLFPIFFDLPSWHPKTELIESLRPAMTSYDNYRFFGLFFEFAHQKFFADHDVGELVIRHDGELQLVKYRDDLSWTSWNVSRRYESCVSGKSLSSIGIKS